MRTLCVLRVLCGEKSSHPGSRPLNGRGFTLIEVVVVLMIITIILGMVGVNLTRNPADILREEAERLALVLQNAQQEAILEGRMFEFTYSETGYRFSRLESSNGKNRRVPIEFDELLAPRKLPPAIALTPTETADSSKKSTDASKRFDPIVFDPSGELPVFSLALSIGDLFWYVRGQSDGQVLSSPLAEPANS